MTNTSSSAQDKPLDGWRLKLYTIIFEADTVAGRRFDQAVLIAILVSVAVVVLDSVQSLQTRWGGPSRPADARSWSFCPSC